MKMLAALLALTAPISYAAEPDLCADPIKAVCSQKYDPPVASEEAVRDRAKAIALERLGSARLEALRKAEDPTAPSMVADYVVYQNAVYDAVLEKLALHGISEQGLTDHLLAIRQSVAGRLRAGLGPESGPTSAKGYSDEKLAKAVERIILLGPRRLKIGGNHPELARMDLDGYFANCGGDGMTRNAFYAAGAFTLCPGTLMAVLETGTIHSLDFITAHEMGHAVDSRSSPATDKPSSVDHPLWQRYGGMMACVEKHYKNDLVEIGSAASQLTDRVIKPGLAKIAALEKADRPDDQALLKEKRKVNAFTSIIGGMREEEAAMRKRLGRAPRVSETHSGEMCADHYGNHSLVAALHGVSPQERAKIVKATYRWLCKRPSESFVDLKYEIVKGDGTHPPPEWRIYESLQNPSLRLSLGCASVAGERPWCGHSGRKSLAAACGPPVDQIGSAEACEESLRKQLKGSCDLNYLSCVPMQVGRQACEMESVNCSLPTQVDGGKRACREGGQRSSAFVGKAIGYICRSQGAGGSGSEVYRERGASQDAR